jgi:hypothetical protein
LVGHWPTKVITNNGVKKEALETSRAVLYIYYPLGEGGCVATARHVRLLTLCGWVPYGIASQNQFDIARESSGEGRAEGATPMPVKTWSPIVG